MIWIGGVVLMVALYVIGPQDFIRACEDYVGRFWLLMGDLIEALSTRAFDAVRAAAIALFAVFVVLAVLASRRGLRSGGALFIVSVLFVLLVETRWYEPGTKWFSALVLAGNRCRGYDGAVAASTTDRARSAQSVGLSADEPAGHPTAALRAYVSLRGPKGRSNPERDCAAVGSSRRGCVVPLGLAMTQAPPLRCGRTPRTLPIAADPAKGERIDAL